MASRRLKATLASSVRRERIEWLWPERIPAIGVTLLAGDPGLGKSTLSLELAARLSDGALNGSAEPEGGVTLLATAEDSWGAVVRPRLEAASAALESIAFLGPEGDEEAPLALPDDVGELERLVEDTAARLVVIDPLMAFLPDAVNSWRDQSIRRALAPLHMMAERQSCAVVCIVHLNKGGGEDPLHRTGGSIGIPGAARSALLFARDPDDPDGDRGSRRILAQFKSNYGSLAPSLLYEVESFALPGDDRTTPRFRCLGESDRSARALLSSIDTEARVERDDAIAFLRDELAQGPVSAKEIRTRAREAGHTEITVKRAKAELGVISDKDGFFDGWMWRLPEGGLSDPGDPLRQPSGKSGERGDPLRSGSQAPKGITPSETLIPFDEQAINGGNTDEGDHPGRDSSLGVSLTDDGDGR